MGALEGEDGAGMYEGLDNSVYGNQFAPFR
jgi:hypothetical protein